MADKDYKAFIVEGEAREPLIIDNISKVFFTHANFKIITLLAGQNIYMLWKKLKEDDFDTDIIEVLREEHEELKGQLEGISRDDFSEVYLFFDYDGHQNNLSEEDDADVLEQMLVSFDNETENGKLYISYPMVEAMRDFEEGKCGKEGQCFVPIAEIGKYKFVSAEHSFHPSFKDYDITVWKSLIEVFAMRISCLMDGDSTITYEQYADAVSPVAIYKMEEEEIRVQRVFILSAFPEFLLDYFGVKLWRTCVKHTGDLLRQKGCK
ncbi:MAG: hypothetical protein ACI4E5_03205 [Suilimivivens sp.]